uniref:Retrotransposon Copia-like N-terminal domain-containing protein n=1 Tax=Manihot esculenta TaxID=3983 RepID=A0A2C9VIK0_MANES
MTVESFATKNTNSNNNYLTNPSNSYFLHSNENSALILVSPVLSGPNYHSWAKIMKMVLQSKNKIRFIDKSLKKPEKSDSIFAAWDRYNNMVLLWITKSLP